MGVIRDLLNLRRVKYAPIFAFRGEYQGSSDLYESDIVGAIAHCIASNLGKLTPQVVRRDNHGLTIKDDYLARILGLRWAAEITPYDGLYKMASDLVYKSNAFAVIFYTPDFSKVQSIVPVTVRHFRIWEDEDAGVIYFRFTWDYDGKEYTLPYSSVIHIKARFNKKRFIGTPPDAQLKTTLELLDTTGESLRNVVNNGSGLKGYLQYKQLAKESDLKKKVKEFQDAYMGVGNDGGLGGLDATMEFHEINQKPPQIPVAQASFLRENVYRYYNMNEKILNASYTESEWNAFYEAVIEPIAIQLSLEFTFKLLSERERGFGNRILFTANRLQYATLQTRVNLGAQLFDRGIITINEYRELMYFEPIEDGDVRMVSLNYVKADDQSIYQIGKDTADGNESGQQDKADAAAGASITERINVLYIPTVKASKIEREGV